MKVKSVTHRQYKGPVYDLDVDKSHAYYANGIRVHNCHCRLQMDREELMEMATGADALNFWNGSETVSRRANAPQETWESVKNIKEAQALAGRKFPKTTFNFEGAKIETIIPTMRAFEQLANEHPKIAELIRHIGTGRGGKELPKRMPARAFACTFTNGVIGLNASYYGNPLKFKSALEYAEQIGWHPKGCNTIEFVIQHEFGHMVKFVYQKSADAFSPYVREDGLGLVQEAVHDFTRKNLREGLGEISTYAKSNFDEAWAEAFGSAHSTPQQDKHEKVLKLQGLLKVLDESKWRTDYKYTTDIPLDKRHEVTKELERIAKEAYIS